MISAKTHTCRSSTIRPCRELEVFIALFRTTFSEFSSRHAKDERFRAIEKVRDREACFHEYVLELKTRVKEGSNRPSSKEKVLFILLSTRSLTPARF